MFTSEGDEQPFSQLIILKDWEIVEIEEDINEIFDIEEVGNFFGKKRVKTTKNSYGWEYVSTFPKKLKKILNGE